MPLRAQEDCHRRRLRDSGPVQDLDRSESLEAAGCKFMLLLASGDSGMKIRHLPASGRRVAEKMASFCRRQSGEENRRVVGLTSGATRLTSLFPACQGAVVPDRIGYCRYTRL